MTKLELLDDGTILANYATILAIQDGLEQFTHKEQLVTVCKETFNLMVEKIPSESLSILDVMKINMLACAIEGELNIVKMIAMHQDLVLLFKNELERRKGNAPT